VDGRSRMAVTRVEWRETRMEYATRGRFGGLGLKTIGGRFHEFEPQNPGGGSKRNGQHVAASRSLRRGEAI
jgi:hypothetical protein